MQGILRNAAHTAALPPDVTLLILEKAAGELSPEWPELRQLVQVGLNQQVLYVTLTSGCS